MRLGFLSKKNTRDLSKEIWISWGYGESQEGGVYVNALGREAEGFPGLNPLKNALGDNMDFSISLYNWNGGLFDATVPTSGPLDIINRKGIVVSYYPEFDSNGNIIINSTSSSPVEVYVLTGRQNSPPGDYQGWGISPPESLPSGLAAPIQTEMNISEDWYKIPNLLASGSFYLVNVYNEDSYFIVRAIVIKLL